MLNHKTLPPSGPLSYLHGSELKTWTSYWKREGSAGMDMWNAPTVQSRQPLTYRLMESVGLGGPRWLGSSWRRGIAESGSSQLLTLMIETPGDLVWDLPCVQQASCLEGGPLLWKCPYTCTLIKNPMMMMMMIILFLMENPVSKQWRPWSDATLWSVPALFAYDPFMGFQVRVSKRK